MKDIEDLDDIKIFVDEFYLKVKKDLLIGPIFLEKIPENWQPHLEKMYAFWNAALFGMPGFRGNPFAKHAPLNIEEKHFERWLVLFKETIQQYFNGNKATETIDRANLMASMFLNRLNLLKGDTSKVVF
jgi:hemoglobin